MDGNQADHRFDSTHFRIAVLQRVCTHYRVPLFRLLSKKKEVQLRLFIGDDVPGSKVRSSTDLYGIDIIHLPSRFIWIKGRNLIDHRGLMLALIDFQPDVILCEGESNLLSTLKAIGYRWLKPHVALIHWSLGGLPGEPMVRKGMRGWLVNALRRRFDTFITYSSYGKHVLMANGFSKKRIFVATNVSDVSRHLEAVSEMSNEEARRRLNLPDRFTVLFVGTMTVEKRLNVLLEAAEDLDHEKYNIVMVGDGNVFSLLQREIARRGLSHVQMPGNVVADLPYYYRAANVMALPGRGGMVISEAMAYGLPVIAYNADGTEYDLVLNGETGVRMSGGTAEELRAAIVRISENPEEADDWGRQGRLMVKERFTTVNMVEHILAATKSALMRRDAVNTPSTRTN